MRAYIAIATALASVYADQHANLSTPMMTIGVSSHSNSSVLISDFSFLGGSKNTTNLPPVLGNGDTRGGSTLAVALGGNATLTPTCGPACAITSTPTTLSATGMQLVLPNGQLFATEDWTFTALNASAISWEVLRFYGPGATTSLIVDRLGLTLQTTGGLPIYAQQIPSYLDLSMFLNVSSTGGFNIYNSFYEFLSPNTRQDVRFSPTGARFILDGTASYSAPSQANGLRSDPTPLELFFSFAKPHADGTAFACNIGYEAVDPRGTPRAIEPGGVQTMLMTLYQVSTDAPSVPDVNDPWPFIDVKLPNATIAQALATLAAVQYQTNGWIFGNNPASVPCLHEMSWWPLITGLFPAGSPAMIAMQQELTFFAQCGWQPGTWPGTTATVHSCNTSAGALFGMTQRYAADGFYDCEWGPLQDQNVMFPIAVYYTALSTGDAAWVASMKPALQAMEIYLAQQGLVLPGKHDGVSKSSPVVFMSPASGLADGSRHASNWYDVILFGHYDAYLAVHGVWALQCLAQLYAFMGDAPSAAHAQAVHDASVVDFNALFWNSSSSAYTDWIDVDGNARSYFYVDIAFTAIIAGVANASQTAALLDHYDTRLSGIYAEYNVPAGNIWSPPCNLYAVTDSKEYANNEGPMTFPMYENGGSFFHSIGLQLAALGVGLRPDDAYEAFQAVMDSGFGDIRGWAQQLYWGSPDSLVGFDPLNTALVAVWGFMRAGFGVEPTLAGALRVTNPPALVMEGAQWNISVMGKATCVLVQGGATRFCVNGTAV